MSSQGRRIFMTGASGYIGSVITTFAIAQGYTVHGLSRSEVNDARLKNLGAVAVRGDLQSLDVLCREAAEADVVIHLADAFGGSRLTLPYAEVLKIDAAAVDAMAVGLSGHGADKIMVHTSGSLVSQSDPEGNETDEESPLAANLPIKRAEMEQNGLEICKKRGVKACAVRLAPWVYGRAGSGVKLFMQMAIGNGAVICIDGGANYTSVVHVDDSARLYLLAVEKAKGGEVFNATTSERVTLGQLCEAMGSILNVPVRSLTLEEATAKSGPFLARFLSAENRASSAKAMRDLGWQPKEIGILDDIYRGSYPALARELRQIA